jgi:23S rRNA pseudouridine2605 synthase
VRVDGELVLDPARDVDADSRVSVDGHELDGPERRVVLLLNKPLGVLSTASDPFGRATVLELVPKGCARLYPVGRLDRDTSGLLLLTNDGELANLLTHPRFHVPKTYRARLATPVGEPAFRALRTGVTLDDGPTAHARARRLAADTIELTIHEGRNRQVRRMCEAVGHRVLALERIRIGALALDGVEPGSWRRLTSAEVAALRALAEPPVPPAGGSRN